MITIPARRLRPPEVTLPDEASALVARGPAESYIDYLGERLADHPAAVDAACELARLVAAKGLSGGAR